MALPFGSGRHLGRTLALFITIGLDFLGRFAATVFLGKLDSRFITHFFEESLEHISMFMMT